MIYNLQRIIKTVFYFMHKQSKLLQTSKIWTWTFLNTWCVNGVFIRCHLSELEGLNLIKKHTRALTLIYNLPGICIYTNIIYTFTIISKTYTCIWYTSTHIFSYNKPSWIMKFYPKTRSRWAFVSKSNCPISNQRFWSLTDAISCLTAIEIYDTQYIGLESSPVFWGELSYPNYW